jgi:OOP family OmpA-OmpF porin
MNVSQALSLTCLSFLLVNFVNAQPKIDRIKNKLNQKSTSVADRVVEQSMEKVAESLFRNDISSRDNSIKKSETDQLYKNIGISEDNKGELYKHFSFIPGEKIVYIESFEQYPLGKLPSTWNGNSSGNLVKFNKEPWLNLVNGNYITNLINSDFGSDFSLEFDLVLNVSPQTGYYLPYFKFGVFALGSHSIDDNSFLSNRSAHKAFELRLEPSTSLSSKTILISHFKNMEVFRSNRLENRVLNERLKKRIHVAVSVTGTRLQVWIDEHKLIDMPKAIQNTGSNFSQLFFGVENTTGYNEDNFAYLVTNIKVATGIEDKRFSLNSSSPFVTTGIVFSSNSSELLPSSYGIIRKIGIALKEQKNIKVKIIGHTDADGSPDANMRLSLDRAKAVKEALINDFDIKDAQILVDGKGSTLPVASNNTKEGKAENRRVEFEIVH